MNTTIIMILVAIVLVVGGLLGLGYYRKKQLDQFFAQVYENVKQVPKQKKNSFLLLMFKESVTASKKKKKSKNKNATGMEQLNNPKYVEIQLIQMTNILKDPSKVEDKTIKSALQLLNDYQKWEKEKASKDKATDKPSLKNKAS